ncbi:MAG: cytochrome C peroxidase, partial [Fimbriimonadaceae bacterium]|nr:cytochrome C peroxidase [Chitinophagales bacterium]
KILFFDPVLSVNNKRACASCHQPAKAFTDGLTKSTALDFKGTIRRNAPTLINAALQGSYFYDVRAEFPETQIDHVVFHADEFNTTYEAIIEKLKQSPEYISLFKEAFPDQPGNALNGFTITKSIADYVRSLIAMDSEFDKYMRNEKTTLDENIKDGYNLFMGKAQCGTCHFAPTFYGTVPPDFTESETEVLGVPSTKDTLHTTIDNDKGRYDIQNVPVYEFAFKTQTVRNIQLTAPYMHNGVYTTLEEIMDFYNRGGAAGLNIELEFQTLPPDKLNLSKIEIADIISFMQSLTDTTGTTSIPAMLPSFPNNPELTKRKIGGEY